MIVVAGEALMDVLAEPGGALRALPGGAPFNVARAVAWQGADCVYLGRLSDDRFGDQLREHLRQAGVRLALPAPTRAPTPLAFAELDAAGSAGYRFYCEGTACARVVGDAALRELIADAGMFVFGGIVLGLEPVRSTLLELVRGAPPELTILCDPNCRPGAIHDRAGARRGLAPFLARVDIVKASADDLELLAPGVTPVRAARGLIGAGPSAVLITDGPRPVQIVTATELSAVAVEPVEVIDTIGAGDAFVAGFVTWWTQHGPGRSGAGDLLALQRATRHATAIAATACRVRGAGLAA